MAEAPAEAPAHVPMALTIAGSDSGGGAGLQADLRTFAALEVYGASVVTAVTAQSTREVRAVFSIPEPIVAAQIDTVLDDLPIRVIKTGMLHRAQIVALVAERIAARRLVAVVDPVMVAESGARLCEPAAERAYLQELMPRCRVITPNLPEVAALLGRGEPSDVPEMIAAAQALIALGAPAALVKGGHLRGDPVDVLLERGAAPLALEARRIATRATHGTGCTYSAAIAAALARGQDLAAAVRVAHDYLHRAIAAASAAPPIGGGKGPVHHLHPFYAWPPG
jgi:hydroxymethylpyrimidine/phosphomethylpyrimidine kinase